MDFNGAVTYLQNYFSTEWASLTDIVERNEFYTATAQEKYVGHEFVEAIAYESKIGRKQGSVGETRIRHEGIWTIKVMSVLGTGVESTLSNRLKEIAECKSMSGIITYPANQTYSGKSIRKGFWEEQYAIRFTFDEVK